MKRVGPNLLAVTLVACAAPPTANPPAALPSKPQPVETAIGTTQIQAQVTVKLRPFQTPKNEVVRFVMVRWDGNDLGSCDLQYRGDEGCDLRTELEPGSHTFEASISCRDPKTLRSFNCNYTLHDRLILRVGERMTLDFAAAFADPSDLNKALVREARPTPDANTCWGALEHLMATPTCQSDELIRFQNAAAQVESRCDARSLATDEAAHALSQAADNLQVRAARCFEGPDQRSLSRCLGNSSWPAGTIEHQTSWQWSRSTLPENWSKLAPSLRLKALIIATQQAIPRARVEDELAAACAKQPRTEAIQKAALAAPWSLDPRKPEGHRNYFMVAGRLGDSTYVDFVAKHVLKDPSVHCDKPRLSRLLTLLFTDDEQLTRTEWQTVQAMVHRTPTTSRASDCDYAFRDQLGTQVPHAERVRWLGEWDCSPQHRHATLLGTQLEHHLRTEGRLPESDRSHLETKFQDCIKGHRRR